MREQKDLVFTDEEMKTIIIIPAPNNEPQLTDELTEWLRTNEPRVQWAPRHCGGNHKLVFCFESEKGALHFKMRFG